MPINIQDNLIHPKERHVRTELWKQKIYHLPFNPYKFPKNDGSGDFVPLPKRFSEILAEFHQFIDDQKAQEKTEEEKQAAKERIKEIYEEIKEIIQLEIEYVRDLSPSDFGGEAEELEEKVKELKNDIAEIDKTVKEVAIESGEKTKELNLLKKKLPISITDIYYWTKWKNISPSFTEELVKKWIEYGFSYNTCADWINIGFKPNQAEYAFWLEKELEYDPLQFLNETSEEEQKDLREQFGEYKENNPSFEQIRKDIEQLEAKLAELKKTKEELSKEKTNLAKELKEAEKAKKDHEIQPEKAKEERRKNLELGLQQRTVRQFKKFNQEIFNSEEITELLEEWEEQRKIVLDKKNVCFIEEDNADSLVFCYQPPEGDFHALDDFLWYRNNIWYETIKGSWRRINHENAVVAVKRSFFIHNYHKFFLGGANGVFHNHPKFIGRREICQCPSFLESTVFVDFACDWKPDYNLWQLEDKINYLSCSEDGSRIPYLSTIKLKKLQNASDFERGLKEALLFLMPGGYSDCGVWMKPAFKINFSSLHTQKPLIEWAKQREFWRGMKNEHLLKHCSMQFFWNSKLIYTNTLDNINLEHMYIDIKANPSGIMYKFQSGSTFFRWSEDVQFNIDRDVIKETALNTAQSSIQGAIQGAGVGAGTAGGTGAIAGGVAGLVGGLFNMAKGERQNVENMTLKSIYKQVETKESKSKDEGQTERKTKYAGTAAIVGSAIGSIPSILSPSHTKNDYTLIEFVLRYNDIPLQVRLNYNENLAERYSMNKALKQNGNEIFNTKRIGDNFQRGYIKAIPIVFEGDRDGYFASLLSKGVYFYEHDPSEFFEEKLERKKHESVSLLQTTTITMTTIYENYASAIGRDNLVHVDDMSWVWKSSYLKPKVGGTDLFPQLINGMRHNIKQEDSNAWKFNGYSNGDGKVILQKDLEYNWYMKAFSSGQEDKMGIRTLDDGTEATLTQTGANWELKIGGRVEITKRLGNPDDIGSALPGNEVMLEELPDMEDEKQTAGLESLENQMQAEAEQQNEFDKELLDELQRQEEKADEKAKEDELDPEPDRTKEEQKQDEQTKDDDKSKEDKDDVERSGNEK